MVYRDDHFTEQPTNTEPNKRILTRSHTACHNQPATQTLTQTTTFSIPQDNMLYSTIPFTQQMSNIDPTYRIQYNPTLSKQTTQNHMHSTDPKKKEDVSSLM